MIGLRSIYSQVYLPWQQNTVFAEELGGLAPFSVARTFASHILTTLVRVCVRRGGSMGAKQSITSDTHKAHFMGIKAVMCACVCAYMCCHGYMVRLARKSKRVRVCLLSSSACSACCVLFCVCGCVCRQISKNARWEASPYFQAVDLSEAAQRLSLSSLQEKANPNKIKQMLLVTGSLQSN